VSLMSEETTSARRGPLRLLLGMIVRPRATLEYLREHSTRAWWAAAVLAVVLAAAPIVVAGPITARETRAAILAGQEEIAEQRGRALTDEQRNQMVAYGASSLIITVFPAAAGVALLVVGWLAWSGGLYLAAMALGGRSTFRAVFRMVVWTWVPFILRGLLQTVYIGASGQTIAHAGLSGFVQGAPVAGELIAAPLSLGGVVQMGFLSRVDLFMLWNLILLIVGVRVMTRLSRRKTLLITLVVWLLLTALSVAPSIVTGYFAQRSGGL
jgi:hypothetical protein